MFVLEKHAAAGRQVRQATPRLSRSRLALALIGSVLATLTAAGTAPPAFAAPSSIDQAKWAGRKQVVRLSNGIDLAYVEMGNPRGTPVVLLHGYTDTSRVWTIVAPYLGDHRLLIPDQRGHGASSNPECCYAPTDFAHDLKLFLDALNVPKAAIVGSSMGSMVAQLFAAEHPERTSAIVLAGSTALAPLDRTQPLVRADGPEQPCEQQCALSEGVESGREPDASRRRFRPVLRCGDDGGSGACLARGHS